MNSRLLMTAAAGAALVTAVCALGAPAAFAAAAAAFPNARAVLDERPQAAAVDLVGGDGLPVSLDRFKGRWVWLYFGFANCPDACPNTLSVLARAYDKLKRPEAVQTLFVSVDPTRDTPASLAKYMAYFHPRFAGLTGTPAALDALTASLGTRYSVPATAKAGTAYSVGHPDLVFVLDPQGRLAATYAPGGEGAGERLAADFDALLGVAEGAAPVGVTASAPPVAAPVDTSAAWCGIDLGAPGADAAVRLMARARTLGSGTAVLPALSPMRMLSWRLSDWLWMLHGDLTAGYNAQGGPRGELTWAAENWQMAMGSRYLGPGILDLRLMTSLEPWTLPPGGSPQLFQFGETYQGRSLIDRQHPHDLITELAGRYTWNLSPRTSVFGYGGLAGEPALGPAAFMHRPSAADNHWAPLAHHLQDGAHLAFGVATAGVRQDDYQLEASVFNGKEPDENRYDLEFGPLSSWSTRVSWFPGSRWATQFSYGQLKDPERAFPGDVHRTTASTTHIADTAFGPLSTTLVWGQNVEFHTATPLPLQSYALESQWDLWRTQHVYGRYELVDRVGLIPGDRRVRRVNALTLGYVRDLGDVERFALGLGADATVYSQDAALSDSYGPNPVSFRVYLRLRPPTMPAMP